MLKYDQTGEALQAAGRAERGSEETCVDCSCSVLTPEQICSQLSMVLHSRGGGVGVVASEGAGRTPDQTAESNLNQNVPLASFPRKPTTKGRREKKCRKEDQPKRAKKAESKKEKLEKRPRRRLRQNRRGKGTREKPLENAEDPRLDFNPPCAPVLLSPSPYVVEISPEKITLEANQNVSNPNPGSLRSPTLPTPTRCLPPILVETPCLHLPATEVDPLSPPESRASNTADFEVSPPTLPSTTTTTAALSINASPVEVTTNSFSTILGKGTSKIATKPHGSSSRCRTLDYALLGRLIGEPLLTSFYQSFHSCWLSEHLNIDLLDPLTDSSNPSHDGAEILPKWLQVTQKRMHIDPHLGPLTLARILLSNSGVIKLQILFPFTKTVFTRLLNCCNIEELLSELSPQHVLCPGLMNYRENHTILGFHPKQVRVFQTPFFQRFDHKHCPIFHSPTSSTAAAKHTENMCSNCLQLQIWILRLIFVRFGSTDPEKRVSFTAKSSLSSSSSSSASFSNCSSGGNHSLTSPTRQRKSFRR